MKTTCFHCLSYNIIFTFNNSKTGYNNLKKIITITLTLSLNHYIFSKYSNIYKVCTVLITYLCFL